MSIDNSMGSLSPMATLAATGKGSARPGDPEQDTAGFASLLQNMEDQDVTSPETHHDDQPSQAMAVKEDAEEREPATQPAPQADGLLLTPAWQQISQLLQARVPEQPQAERASAIGQDTVPGIVQPSSAPKSDAVTTPTPGASSPLELDAAARQTVAAIIQTAPATVPAKPEAVLSDPAAAPPADLLVQTEARPTVPAHLRAAQAAGYRAATLSAPQRTTALSTASPADEPAQMASVSVAPTNPGIAAAINAAHAIATASARERSPTNGRAALAQETVATLQPLLEAAAQAAAAPTPARQAQPAPTATGDGAWGAQALMVERHVESSNTASASSAGEAIGAQTLTEQISYWIGNEIQSASVSIDQDAQDPVQISVSLQGDEAHVRFQVESPEIRRFLESTTTDLRDLLRAQGLELAGVSIDAAGTPDAGARDAGTGNRRDEGQRHSDDTRSSTPPTRSLATPRLPGQGSHRLDIYV